ncbi:caspase domain-containing protein [Lactarius psammicola]|nr:caspase domain-containing protein [Lactarius psammicola]
MHWLAEGAQPDDSLFFYFSGNAGQVKDTNEDEPDRLDEYIYAVDYMGDAQSLSSPTTPGIIVDDEMHDIMVKPLPPECRLTAVFDCCHSGTIFDLPFIYDSRGVIKPYNPDVVHRGSSDAEVVSAVFLGEKQTPTISFQICLSACTDNGRAGSAHEGGALSRAFIQCMKSWGNCGTYLDIVRSLRAYMDTKGLRQRPQLSSSRPIDINQRFRLTGGLLQEFTVPPPRYQLEENPASSTHNVRLLETRRIRSRLYPPSHRHPDQPQGDGV